VLLKQAGIDHAEAAEQILSKRKELSLDHKSITDIRPLDSLINLTTLDLSFNHITDISSLGSLTNLKTLNLSSNKITITDISSLGSLTNLTTLHLDSNQITDISSLGSLTNLTTLHLHSNQITDFSVLRSLTNLTMLSLDSYKIDPLSVSGELAEKRLTLSTTPIDAEKATATVKVAYATISLEEPEVIICSSPRETYLQIFNLPTRQYSQHRSDEWHWNRFGKKLDWRMYPSIVRDFVSPAVWQYEVDSMTMESEVDSILSSLIYELVGEDEESEPEIMNCCADDSFDLISPETPTALFKEIYLTEFYISLLGINLSRKAQEIHHCQKLLLEHCGWIFPFEKICAVCDRPCHLRFDSQNRLHAEAEPAIEFADGWNFYYYHGVRLPEKYGQIHPNQWQSQWLLSEDNAELKRVLIQGIGYDRIIQELSAQQIDSWQEYALLRIDNADVEPIYLLKMTCPSTGFIHALRVPPNLTSAREAIRWVNWDIDPEEFSVQT
jgi:Leucine Rich repeats (2 copies)